MESLCILLNANAVIKGATADSCAPTSITSIFCTMRAALFMRGGHQRTFLKTKAEAF